MSKTELNNAKILVCTINAWNSKVGDNTFSSLLSSLPSKNIASLFIREDNPNSQVASRYFRVSETKVMKSIFKPRIKTGEEVDISILKNTTEREKSLALYGKKTRFYYAKLFIREFIWLIGKWKTNELNAFIDNFSPDIIIYEMSRYIHLNRMVNYIIKRTGAKGVGCFWDDTFTYKQEKTLGYKALRFLQRINLKSLAKNTKTFFAITPKTKREADLFFNINCSVLSKYITEFSEYKEPTGQIPLKMLYTGNLTIGREDTMLLVVNELKKLNKDGVKVKLDIYTNTVLSKKYITEFNTSFSVLHDAISQSEVIKKQEEADILLFVESLKEKNKIARLSFSTKITDYYASGKCIFAVGNDDLAPMELFKEERSAITVTNESELKEKINLLTDKNVLEYYSKMAFKLGKEKYSSQKVIETFFDGLIED